MKQQRTKTIYWVESCEVMCERELEKSKDGVENRYG